MQLFSADATMFSKKILKYFFDPEKVKKRASKVAHNRPNPFFPQSSPDHSPQPRIDFLYHEISGPDICSLICVQKHMHRKRMYINICTSVYVQLGLSMYSQLL